MKRILRSTAPLLCLLLLESSVTAQPTVRASGQFLTVEGIVEKYGAIVKIIGPGGYRYRGEFAPGKLANINLMDAIDVASRGSEAAFLHPGVYTYEVIARPSGERLVGSFRVGDPPPGAHDSPSREQLDVLGTASSTASVTENDYISIVDSANDGVTALSLQSDNSPSTGLVNKNGVLSVRRHSGTINGDVGAALVQFSQFSSTGDAAVGIGTATPQLSLEIVGYNPSIFLEDTSGGVNWKLSNGGGDFVISSGGASTDVVVIEGDSPQDSFRINASGVTLSSSRTVKKDIEPAASALLLEKLAELPIFTWSYADDESGAVHVGPMSEDFHQQFGFGANPTRISPLDTSGLALAGVQALRQELEKKDAEIAELKAAVEKLLAEKPDELEEQE
jgi:hypothetical protein